MILQKVETISRSFEASGPLIPILPGLPSVGDPGDSAEIAVETCLSPFQAPSPLPSVEKALNIDVNLTLPGGVLRIS